LGVSPPYRQLATGVWEIGDPSGVIKDVCQQLSFLGPLLS
jgi:hypothetical protein